MTEEIVADIMDFCCIIDFVLYVYTFIYSILTKSGRII